MRAHHHPHHRGRPVIGAFQLAAAQGRLRGSSYIAALATTVPKGLTGAPLFCHASASGKRVRRLARSASIKQAALPLPATREVDPSFWITPRATISSRLGGFERELLTSGHIHDPRSVFVLKSLPEAAHPICFSTWCVYGMSLRSRRTISPYLLVAVFAMLTLINTGEGAAEGLGGRKFQAGNGKAGRSRKSESRSLCFRSAPNPSDRQGRRPSRCSCPG